jgi:hypothetical protein
MADDKLSITYSSGLIPPPELMSTLAVFYDEIWLPQPYELDPKSTWKNPLLSIMSHLIPRNREDFVHQKRQWSLLYDSNLLKALPGYDIRKSSSFNQNKYDEELQKYFTQHRLKAQRVSKTIHDRCMISHLAYTNKLSPELFISNPSDTSTSRLAGFLADAIFQLKIPQLKTLNAEQILEVRYKLRNFKEGFTDYVIRLTNDVEALLRSGETSEAIAAQKIAERHFETEYNQIRRDCSKDSGSRISSACLV